MADPQGPLLWPSCLWLRSKQLWEPGQSPTAAGAPLELAGDPLFWVAMGGESASHASLRGLFFFLKNQHLGAFSLQLTPSALPSLTVLQLSVVEGAGAQLAICVCRQGVRIPALHLAAV